MQLEWNDTEVKNEVARIAWDSNLPALSETAVQAVRGEAPVDTGLLKSRIRAETKALAGGLVEIEIIANTDYSLIVVLGRGEVRPVNAKALHWVNKLGEHVFAQRSRAVPPNRFISRGLRAIGLDVKDE